MNFLLKRNEKIQVQTDNNNNQFAFLFRDVINLKSNTSYFCETEKPLLMFHYITRAEYLQKIKDDLLEHGRLIRSSRAVAAEVIDSLGIRHLCTPMTEEEIKEAEEKRAKASLNNQ